MLFDKSWFFYLLHLYMEPFDKSIILHYLFWVLNIFPQWFHIFSNHSQCNKSKDQICCFISTKYLLVRFEHLMQQNHFILLFFLYLNPFFCYTYQIYLLQELISLGFLVASSMSIYHFNILLTETKTLYG